MSLKHLAALAILALTASPLAANASVLILQPDESTSKDAQIDNEAPDQNSGNDGALIIPWFSGARSVGLLQFDLSGIPGGATVNNAALNLFQALNANSGIQYDVFRITSAWDEATVTFNTAPTFDPIAVASFVIPDNNTAVPRGWDVATLVQGWVNGDYANYGMWIEEVPIQGAGAAYFSASNDGDANRRPMLIVTYSDTLTPVPEPVTLGLLTAGLLGIGALRRRA